MQNYRSFQDPFKLGKLLWPDVNFYSQQREIVMSVWNNKLTVVPAGHQLGKDFVSGFICLAFFLTRHPCRIVTTSVDGSQLQSVLWGEIKRFIQTSRIELNNERGGPLVVNHMRIRKMWHGEVDALSYLIGRVSEFGEGMSGHHIAQTGDGVARTLFLADECSGVREEIISKASEWANRSLLIGNPYACTNTFYWAVKGKPGTDDKGGDIPRENGHGYLRKVLKIKATDSPNVRFGLAQKAAGIKPTNDIKIPGVLPYEEYIERRRLWDEQKQCAGLDAEFYEGAEVLMFPPQWLNRAEILAQGLANRRRKARAMGIDPAEGGDKTAWVLVDEWGVVDMISLKTPDTSMIVPRTIALMKEHGIAAQNVVFDRGGGGKEHADSMRQMGYDVRTVAFGEAVGPPPRYGRDLVAERIEQQEERYAYKNRRAEMYGRLRFMLDPKNAKLDYPEECQGFGVPARFAAIRQQLAPIPLEYDAEGRMRLLPKRGPEGTKTLTQLIGHSPDEADALVLALHGMCEKPRLRMIGAYG